MPEATATPATINDFLAEPLTVGDPEVAGPLTAVPALRSRAGPQLHQLRPGPRAGRQDQRARGRRLGQRPARRTTRPTTTCCSSTARRCSARSRTAPSTSPCWSRPTRACRSRSAASRPAAGTAPATARPSRPPRRPPTRGCASMKAERVRASAFAGRAARADQGEVWDEADQLADRYEAHSPTRATHQVYESRRGRLDEICAAITLHPGQVGAIAAYRRRPAGTRLRQPP